MVEEETPAGCVRSERAALGVVGAQVSGE